MQDIVIGLAIKWIVAELATASAAYDWTGFKVKVKVAIEGSVHSAWMDAELEKLANDCIDAIAKIGQDQPDVKVALQSLASKNMPAAEAAMKAILVPVVSPELGAIVSNL